MHALRCGRSALATVSRICPVLHRRWHDVATPGRLGIMDAESSAPGALSRLLQMMHRRPLMSAAAMATTTAAVGDMLAQLTLAFDSGRAGSSAPVARPQYANPHAAVAAMLASPKLIDGALPETGWQRTARFAATVGILAGIGGELWFRGLLMSYPGWTYNSMVRTVVDQVTRCPPSRPRHQACSPSLCVSGG